MSWQYILCLASVAFALEPRVLSGDDLRFDIHKYLVRLDIFYSSPAVAKCSGCIINKYWIITSAHCFRRRNYVYVYHAISSERPIAKVDPRYIFMHPKFKIGYNTARNRVYDIALLKTKRAIKFGEWVQPVELADQYPKIGQVAIISGYGEVEYDEAAPREGAVTISLCDENLSIPGVFCSNNLVRAASGDSGGPLVSEGKLIGVTSASCRNVYLEAKCLTLYVSVNYHREWLISVMDNY